MIRVPIEVRDSATCGDGASLWRLQAKVLVGEVVLDRLTFLVLGRVAGFRDGDYGGSHCLDLGNKVHFDDFRVFPIVWWVSERDGGGPSQCALSVVVGGVRVAA